MGDRLISWKYTKEVSGEVPKDIFDSSWNKIVNTGYQRAQSSYIIQTELGNKNIDLLSCKAGDLTEEDLLAKNKNYIPLSNYNISEWVKVVNSGFHLGQHFFLNDMRNQQEVNDAQIALSLSAGEQEHARKIESGNNVEQKVKLIYLENNVTLYIQLKSLRGTSIKN